MNEQLVASTAIWMVFYSTVIRIMNGFETKWTIYLDVTSAENRQDLFAKKELDLLLENFKS